MTEVIKTHKSSIIPVNYLARAEGSHLEGTAFLTSSARIRG